MNHTINLNLQAIKVFIASQPLQDQVELLNFVKKELHEISPFKFEPVDCVLWELNSRVEANNYNPNEVAPPEMKLLEISIMEDGYTQPVVTFDEGEKRTVVDGFHRTRVAKESIVIKNRVYGYVPVVAINEHKTDKANRIASTIRHNRARGKHGIDAMSDIVVELKNRNWSEERIGRELGMEPDEILRLCQITGLAALFSDQEFSKSWDIKDSAPDFTQLTDNIEDAERDEYGFRTVNTSDETRIFHTFDKWECYRAGFYNSTKNGMTREECEKEYASFLKNDVAFRYALDRVIHEWEKSCEHYLTNVSMNRIAWLGQASLCYAKAIPSVYRGGFNLLSEDDQLKANKVALVYLNKWLENHDRPAVSLTEAMTEKQTMIY